MKCERCHQETVAWQMSWFNTQEICMACREKEKAHPLYPEAKAAILAEEAKGNRNYEGIGLPDDLK